jgi:hypothetical protein
MGHAYEDRLANCIGDIMPDESEIVKSTYEATKSIGLDIGVPSIESLGPHDLSGGV